LGFASESRAVFTSSPKVLLLIAVPAGVQFGTRWYPRGNRRASLTEREIAKLHSTSLLPSIWVRSFAFVNSASERDAPSKVTLNRGKIAGPFSQFP
jgi:hypothetical protein